MDVKLIQNSETSEFDIELTGDDFTRDEGLQTMVAISLFSDAREETRTEDPRGWWGASVLNEDRLGAQFGSKLWLLGREKQIPETLVKIREWCGAALQWMIDAGIAKEVSVAADFLGLGIVRITVEIAGGALRQTFQYLWEGQHAV